MNTTTQEVPSKSIEVHLQSAVNPTTRKESLSQAETINLPDRISKSEVKTSNDSFSPKAKDNESNSIYKVNSFEKRKSSRVPKFIQLENKDYHSLANLAPKQATTLLKTKKELKSIVSSIKENSQIINKNKLAKAARLSKAKRKNKINKIKAGKVRNKHSLKPEHLQNIEDGNRESIEGGERTKRKYMKRKFKGDWKERDMKKAKEPKKVQKVRYNTNYLLDITPNDIIISKEVFNIQTNYSEEDVLIKKRKIQVLPDNIPVVNSFVKYQDYFNQSTQIYNIVDSLPNADKIDYSAGTGNIISSIDHSGLIGSNKENCFLGEGAAEENSSYLRTRKNSNSSKEVDRVNYNNNLKDILKKKHIFSTIRHSENEKHRDQRRQHLMKLKASEDKTPLEASLIESLIHDNLFYDSKKLFLFKAEGFTLNKVYTACSNKMEFVKKPSKIEGKYEQLLKMFRKPDPISVTPKPQTPFTNSLKYDNDKYERLMPDDNQGCLFGSNYDHNLLELKENVTDTFLEYDYE
eukprot:CAMPEP_0170518060 /NCGR_PEP_ID=MMETSP0209-20121228/3846_1 /TAXON_ID=665100 ORGANISM="Litonotus pictus, Strain P1" /NCGR_SAMPLE_ID=MMETSP0209 /ASSEMBLY_ACC=CAM_ASM_000301 /LENGTH=519 /DNA_ID=CAMNT_0010803487 /DNA_START=1 /DNA_END=1560 /DNA_ORIENTATION=+